jgi:hypothetical protein
MLAQSAFLTSARRGRAVERSGRFVLMHLPSTTKKVFYHCFGCGAHGDDIEFAKSKSGSLTLTMSR